MERLNLIPITKYKIHPETLFDLEVDNTLISDFTGNTILFATLNTGKEVVVKSCTYGSSEREWSGLVKAYNHDIPVPTPLALARIEHSGDVVLVSERYYGHTLFEYPDPEKNRVVGAITKQMHKVPITGDEWHSSRKSDYLYYDSYIHRWKHDLAKTGVIYERAPEMITQFSDEMKAHHPTIEPHFTHQDLHDHQFVVVNNGSILITDFELWSEADCLEDIAIYLFHSIRTERPYEYTAEFMHGYFDQHSISEKDKELLAFYTLFTATRAVDHFYTNGSDYLETAQENLMKTIQYIDQEQIWIEY